MMDPSNRGRGDRRHSNEEVAVADEDPDTGVNPASKDGEGASDDDLAKRRKRNGGSMAERGEQSALADGGDPPEEVEESDGQFVWEQGRKVTLANIIARGTPTEHHFVFGGKRSKGTGGLMGFDASPLMIVAGRPGKVSLVPTYSDEGKVTKVVIENHVKATSVANADSEEGLALIAHVLDARGYAKTGKAA